MGLERLTRPANLTGFPAISVPCGFTEESADWPAAHRATIRRGDYPTAGIRPRAGDQLASTPADVLKLKWMAAVRWGARRTAAEFLFEGIENRSVCKDG